MLNDEQVADRVNTTLKLSNVTGDSAEQVSSYMTAIWNNFADGSQSLESFADKITALGAATASSSAEIANGLQQFAAIGNTVGLSYDYAATALATVVAQTRQSETVVGNAFRTIFSRLQGLSLGETLEDGTDLNKYSKALASVGVNIKDDNGQLRSMDDILSDLGTKWKTLSKDQQTALAQTVGGTRQYTQLIALMDNWDKFQENLKITQNSEGTLDEQADIYAESWEAARKRVQASWQSIVQDLLDDKFLIGLTDGLSKFLDILDKVIDSIGGLKGVLATIGSLATTVFAKQMTASIERMQQNIAAVRWPWQKVSLKEKQENSYVSSMNKSAQDLGRQSLGQNSEVINTATKVNNDLSALYEKQNILKQAGLDIDKTDLATQASLVKLQGEELKNLASSVESTKAIEKSRFTTLSNVISIARRNGNLNNNKINSAGLLDFQTHLGDMDWLGRITSGGGFNDSALYEVETSPGVLNKAKGHGIGELIALDTAKEGKNVPRYNEVLSKVVNHIQLEAKDLGASLETTDIENYINAVVKHAEAVENLTKAQATYNKTVTNANGAYDAELAKSDEAKKAAEALTQAKKDEAAAQDVLNEQNLNESKGYKAERAIVNADPQKFVAWAQVISQTSMAVSSLNSVINNFSESVKTGEGWASSFGSAIAALPMIVIGLVGGLNSLNNALALTGTTFRLTFPIYGLIIAGLTAASIIIPQIIDAVKNASPEEQAKKATEAAKEAQQAVESLNNSLDRTSDTLDQLDGVEEKFANLTQGTRDWNEALKENNSTIQDLIEKFNLIEGTDWYTDTETGIEHLTDEGKKAVETAIEEQKQAAQLAIDAANVNKSNKKYNETKDKTGKSEVIDRSVLNDFSLLMGKEASGIPSSIYRALLDTIYKDTTNSIKNSDDLKKYLYETDKDGKLIHNQITDEYTGQTLDFSKNLLDEWFSVQPEETLNQLTEAIVALTDAYKDALDTNDQSTKNALQSSSKLNDVFYGENKLDIFKDNPNLTENVWDILTQDVEKAIKTKTQQYLEAGISDDDRLAYYNKLGYTKQDDDTYKDENDNTIKSTDLDNKYSDEIIADWKARSEEINEVITKYSENADYQRDVNERAQESQYTEKSLDEINKEVNRPNEERNSELEDSLSTKQTKELAKYREEVEDTTDAEEKLGDAFKAVTLKNYTMNEALEDWIKNFDDYKEAIQEGDKYTEEYQTAINTLGQMLDIDPSNFSDAFLQSADNLNLMQEAAYGSADAIEQLRENAAKDIIAQVQVNTDDASIQNAVNEINNFIDTTDFDNFEVGAELDDTAFINALNTMLANGSATVEQIQALLNSLGYEPDIGYEKVSKADVTTDTANAYHSFDGKTFAVATEAQLQAQTDIYVPKIVPGGGKGKGTGTLYRGAPKNMISGANKNKGAKARKQANKGGGGSKKKTTKDHKDLEEQEDRYHNITELLEDINIELSRLDKIEDRVYGKARLKYMDQNIDKLKQQLKLTDEYIAEIKGYAAKDQAKLSGIGMGAQYDANGRLTNYEEVLQNIVADYNNAINTYNAAVDTFNASAQEDSDNAILDAADKTVDAAKKKYDENKKILDQYEDTYNLLQEQLDKRIDQVWALFDKRLEEITYSVEFQLDWNDRDVEYFDWLLKYIGKDSTNASDAIANLAQQMNEYGDSIDTIKEGIKGIFGLHGLSFNFDNPDAKALYQGLANFMDATGMESQLTQDEGKALEDYMSKLMDYYTKMDEAWQNAHEHLMDAWSEWNDKLEDGITSISNYGDEMAHIQKIIDATGQKMLRLGSNDLNKMNQQIVDNAQEQLKAEKSLLDAMEPSVKRAKKAWQDAISAGLSQEVIDKLEEEYKKMRDDYNDQLNDYYSAWENTLDKVEDAFSRALDNMENDYNNTFSKLGLNYLSDEFDRQKDIRDLYLDDYEKYHELNKSAKELADSLEKTMNNMIRGKMTDLQDEINAKMNTGVKISEAEAEIIARRVALLQAEADLMDAQNAKSMVRMTRDNEGNFSYTYTADQDAIDDAQGNYGDKFYDLLDYERNYMDQIQQGMLEKRRQFLEDLRNIAEEYKDDPDAYAQAYAQLLDDYNDYNDYFIDQQQMDFDEMARLRDDDWQDTENLTNLKLAEQDDFITQFHDSIYGGLVPDYQTAAEEGNNWANAMQTACDSATQAITTYEQNSRTTYEAAGQDIEKYGQKAGQVYDDLAQKSENTANEVANDGNQMSGTMAQIQNDAWNLDAAWGSVCDSIRNQIAMTVSALSALLQSLDRAVSKAQTTVAQLQTAATQAESAQQRINNASGSSGSSGSGSDQKYVPSTSTDDTNKYRYTSRGGACFLAGTKITMEDGSLKNIEDISIGDKVMAYDEEHNIFIPKLVTKTFIHRNIPGVMEVTFGNNIRLGMTLGHPILTLNGWKSRDLNESYDVHGVIATLLNIGDIAIGLYGNQQVINIHEFDYNDLYDTYNIEVETCHTYIANGIVVHNAKKMILETSFATGGYTGRWGSDGRLAMLHEKELVLNKEDTANMLDMVNTVRDMVTSIGSNGMLDKTILSAANAAGMIGPTNTNLDQNVHIEASFPNVESHTEIETALNNLINSASQYVNRR